MYPQPNKGLSQVFLVNQGYLQKIASCIEPTETILEIGPGRGELTGYLKDKSKQLILIELDKNLAELLRKRYAGCPHITVKNEDILRVNLEEYRTEQKKIAVAGNLPYHISFKLIEYFARHKACIQAVYASFQKEFGQKLIARPSTKDYSYITCFFRYHFNPVGHFVIPKTAFYPTPNIDTMFVKFLPDTIYHLDPGVEAFLLKLIRNAFLYRRKKISNALAGYVDKEKIGDFLAQSGIDPSSRPDAIPVEKYISLAQLLQKNANIRVFK